MGFIFIRQDEVVDPEALKKDGSVLPTSDFDWNGQSIFNLDSISFVDKVLVSSPVANSLIVEGEGGSSGCVFHIDLSTPCFHDQVLAFNTGVNKWRPKTIPVSGDVFGPAGATDNALCRFDNVTGKYIQNSLALLDDAGKLTTANLNLSGQTAARALVIDSSNDVKSAFTTETQINYLSGVTSDVQDQLNDKLDEFISSTDHAIVRTDGTGGTAVQDSQASVDDNGKITSIDLDIQNNSASPTLQLLSTGGNRADIIAEPDDTATTNLLRIAGRAQSISTDLCIIDFVHSALNGSISFKTKAGGGGALTEILRVRADKDIDVYQGIHWQIDGNGNIGEIATFRPNNLYAKSAVRSSWDANNYVSLDVNGGASPFIMLKDDAEESKLTLNAAAKELQVTENSFQVQAQMYSLHDTESGSGTTHTVDWNDANSTTLDLNDFSGDVTLTLSNPKAGARYKIIAIQQATARNIIWPGNVKWPSGSAPTITVTDDAVDVIDLLYDGTNYFGTFEQDFQ